MQPLKFRTPVICQNGHKGLWYWEIDGNGIGEVKHLGVISNKCDCPKQALGEGYTRNGDDQQFIGLLDKNGKEVYAGDIIKKPFDSRNLLVYWDTRNACWRMTGYWAVNKGDMALMGEVIGNNTENPELVEKNERFSKIG